MFWYSFVQIGRGRGSSGWNVYGPYDTEEEAVEEAVYNYPKIYPLTFVSGSNSKVEAFVEWRKTLFGGYDEGG